MFENDYETENNQDSVIRNEQDDTLFVLRQIVENYCKSKTILDLGSGDGHYHKYFEKINFVGLDINKDYKGKENDFYVDQNIEEFPYRNIPNKFLPFDFVTALDVFEHLQRPDWVLSYLAVDHHILQKGGYVFISVPNINTIDDKLLGINQSVYNPNLKKVTSGRWNSTHLRFFDIPSLINLAETTGYKVSALTGSNFFTSNLISQLGEKINMDGLQYCNLLRNTDFVNYAPNICILLQKK